MNLTSTSKIGLAFVIGLIVATGLQVKDTKASTSPLTGKCALMMTYQLNGYTSGSGLPVNTLGVIDFDAGSGGVIGQNMNLANGNVSFMQDPNSPITGSVSVSSASVSGMYQMTLTTSNGSDTWLAVPANGGNTIYMSSPTDGGTGVCQKI